ncbi:MAG: signal peptidase II [Candidatus Cardinium sp.]|uniref:signal peptidase II n=1 Tax=Cardinium endosymbiont of Dermatophagoides farinae TaxID=2597823 RepID=UPI0011843285|nr:signal peptidase II [Cardinium endosymbiont of Dermatophagoides farinae]TSJ81285.1 lipoprotein signal peptidase [Cardinium endosymbiont of Dermatophagoides farinae]UWW97344.1 MAG: signal peptidase II [Candidatus Cardinium sp.]
MKRYVKYILALLLIILADQGSKLWVYTHMQLGPEHHIKILGNLFKFTYVLNYGMAFGLQFGFKYGKLLITLVRLFASLYIAVHIIRSLVQEGASVWIWGWVCLLGGAIGNTIDSIFYGIYLNNVPDIAPMKWFHGQVIDMLHIDFWSGVIPNWVPIWGGQEVCVLPIFNIADLAIFVGLSFVFFSLNPLPIWKKKAQATNPIV